MKIILTSLVMLMVGLVLGDLYGDRFNLSHNSITNDGETPSEASPLYWVAPMDKNYQRDGPGLSPMGMDLVPVYEDDNSGEEGSVKISPLIENNLGVKTELVFKSPLIMPVETVGTVQFDESKISHIHSRVNGWIEVLNVLAAGDTVKKGQTLYELYSPALVNAQEEYLAALRSQNKNLIRASKSRLFSLGLDEKQAKRIKKLGKVDQRVKVVAAQDGVVIDLNVRQGMFIKPSTEVLSIGSLDSVWILGEIFERQSYLVKKGQEVEIRLNAMPGKTWTGSLNYIYPQLDPDTRTLLIRVRISNPDHFLKPNMLANLRVLSTDENAYLSIPKQALIKAGNHTRVVKSLGDGMYKSVLVKSGFEGIAISSGMTELNSRIQILSGLKEGDSVVTSAQFLIDSESNIDAELARLERGESTLDMKKPDTNSVITRGKIESLMLNMGMIEVAHEPIAEWGWPVMTMSFLVAPSEQLPALRIGDQIDFALRKRDDGDFEISKVTKSRQH